MGETHPDGIPSIYKPAQGCYNFIFKGLIDLVTLYSQMCIRKCNITAFIFLRALNVGAGLNLNRTIPQIWKKEYNYVST